MASKPVTIQTNKLGRLSRTALKKRIREAGSQAALAREIGVADSTVRNWRLRLNRVSA